MPTTEINHGLVGTMLPEWATPNSEEVALQARFSVERYCGEDCFTTFGMIAKMLSEINAPAPLSVIDYGCGMGLLGYTLISEPELITRYVGYDPSVPIHDQREKLLANPPTDLTNSLPLDAPSERISFHQDIKNVEPLAPFDLGLCLSVSYEWQTDEQYLAEYTMLSSLIKDDGIIIALNRSMHPDIDLSDLRNKGCYFRGLDHDMELIGKANLQPVAGNAFTTSPHGVVPYVMALQKTR